MENLNRAFTHINKAFSSINHIFDRRIAPNPDVPPPEVVHVANLDDVQSFLLAPMEVDETDAVPHSCAMSHPNLYVAPMTEELSRQINDAVTNSWRVDLHKDVTPPAPEESDISLGLTQQESTWLKMLMKGPVLRSRARAVEDAAYVKSLDVSTAHLRESDRRLFELLTPKQFYEEVDAFFGSETSPDEEVDVHAQDDADEICLVETDRASPLKKIQMSAVDYSGSTTPFGLGVRQRLDGNVVHERDEMNLQEIFELGHESGVGDDEGCSEHEVMEPITPAETVLLQVPDNEFDMCAEELDYEPPESFDSLSPPRQDYTLGPFMIDNVDIFPHMAPAAGITAHQTSHSEFWQEGLGPAMFSLRNSDQPLDLVTPEGNVVLDVDMSADLQLEAELNASANEHNTESPGPYTKLLKFTHDDDSPITHEMHCPGVKTQEPGLAEYMYTSPLIKERHTPHRARTPSPLKATPPRSRNIPTPKPTTLTILPTLLPKPTPRTDLSSPSTPTKPRPPPQTPKSKSVKAVFASPKLRSGPPSPIKLNNNPDRDTQTNAAGGQTHADSTHRTTAIVTATDISSVDGDTVRVQLPVSGQGLGLGLGIGLGLAQIQPDSAIDVSFPAAESAEKAEVEVSRGSKSKSVSVAVAVGRASTNTNTNTMANVKTDKMTKTTTKKKVGRPRKVRDAVDDGSGGGSGAGGGDGHRGGKEDRGVARSPLRKRARKGARGTIGGGGI